MRFEDLVQFIERDIRTSHVYQPVMLRELLDRHGRASRKDIGTAIRAYDEASNVIATAREVSGRRRRDARSKPGVFALANSV
jgi:hypothetical protein